MSSRNYSEARGPNTSLHRTPAAAPPSPVISKTLGHAGIIAALSALVLGIGCASSATMPPAAPAPPSQILAYQDANREWQEDTGAVAFPSIAHRVNPGIP